MARQAGQMSKVRSLLSLGVNLARRGIMPVASIVICAVTSVFAAMVIVVLASRGAPSSVQHVPLLASSALAWGGGFLLAFVAAVHALRRDRAEGVRALFAARAISLRGYVFARVGGLVVLIAMCVAGGTLLSGLVGLVGLVAVDRAGGALRMLHATLAGVAFSLAFSVVIAPLAFAAVGARSRIGGYFFLIGVVSLPEVIVLAMGSSLPPSVADVLSIPSALAALRSGLAPGQVDLGRVARAVVALSLFVAGAMALVRRDAIRVDEPEVDA